jgi:hypothetical protein
MTEYNRRKSDNQDHDEILSLKASMKYLCTSVKEIKQLQLDQARNCACRFKDCNHFFVPSKVFYTALTIIVLFMGTVGAIAYDAKEDLAVVKHQILQMENLHNVGIEDLEGPIE